MKEEFQEIAIDDFVQLISKPDGCTSKDLPLTVGKSYICLGFDGSNIITTTDDPHISGHYWRGRVVRVPQ